MVVRTLFWGSMRAKNFLMKWNLPGQSLFDLLIFNKVRQVVGGEVFYSMYGGSSLSEETQRFISTAICPVASGYGLTETTA
jgi:long-chain acyl-CoA synthetase